MTNPDASLLDELARCYAAAVVRSLLEGQEEDPGEHLLSTTPVSPEKAAPESTPDEFDMPF